MSDKLCKAESLVLEEMYSEQINILCMSTFFLFFFKDTEGF